MIISFHVVQKRKTTPSYGLILHRLDCHCTNEKVQEIDRTETMIVVLSNMPVGKAIKAKGLLNNVIERAAEETNIRQKYNQFGYRQGFVYRKRA